MIFVIALVTYWLTLEPTASYWDCGEFIIQADKLEIGHPPGNPIFMLTARFFVNFASSPQTVALMVNAMSGLLSALTILLLFWTITHLTRRLIVNSKETSELSLAKYLVIMGSGAVGALAYTWSDTFWFSAVEGEVYAFSSFCTALVFWLILKWENRASEPHSDRYLILIAYIIGVSVAVHLLNLLCIPAITLVFAYRKFQNMNVWRSLAALGISFAIIVLVLYGLVPGFIKVAQVFELFCVNTLHFSFNTGVIIYALLTCAVLVWCLYTLYKQKSALWIRISFIAAVAVSGMLCFTNNGWIWTLLLLVLAGVMFIVFRRGLPVRVLTVITWSIAMIFIGYSSYALILIRSTADTPMNQNSPDNVFALASYLNREQYGDTPLFYGQSYNAQAQKRLLGYSEYPLGGEVVLPVPQYQPITEYGATEYAKGVKGAPLPSAPSLTPGEIAANMSNAASGHDHYVASGHKWDTKTNPELNMLFPRMHSNMPSHIRGYKVWVPELDDSMAIYENMVEIHAIDQNGDEVPELDMGGEYRSVSEKMYTFPTKYAYKPTQTQNLAYFLRYQLNHMYMRYFMWNFAGRQNDILNQGGELDAGNWISGIPFIDNLRRGDPSLLPADLGKNNRGHNVFFMLPLILGLIGLLWQAFEGRKGIEQFWVVFFLFFMTGIAIVLYLNQTPYQPRERDYAYAGSFYAFAIWIGLGVVALWRLLLRACDSDARKARKSVKTDKTATTQPASDTSATQTESPQRLQTICAIIACIAGIIVPLQMVSQTWDDHDRSGRYAARDYAANYLESTDPGAIIFCNGDNDTFPLWYAQEVEGIRPDVRIINLSYLASDWYTNQLYMQAYESTPVPLTLTPQQIAYDNMQVVLIDEKNTTPMNLLDALKAAYAGNGRKENGYATLPTSRIYVPVDKQAVVKAGYVNAADTARIVDRIEIDLSQTPSYRSRGYLTLSDVVMLDIIATNAATGWTRPIYWCSTVGNDYYLSLDPYQATTGLTLQLVPWRVDANAARTDRLFDNVSGKYRWGVKHDGSSMPYYDETAGRMLTGMRSSMLIGAKTYYSQGKAKAEAGDAKAAAADYDRSLKLLDMIVQKQPESILPFSLQIGPEISQLYYDLGQAMGRRDLVKKAHDLIEQILLRYAQYILYQDNIELNFGHVALTYESNAVPLRYWQFVEMYQQFGGNWQKLKSANPILQRLNEQKLQQNWDANRGYFNGLSEGVNHVNNLAAKVIALSAMTEQEYAAAPLSDRQIDTLFYTLIVDPASAGVTAADVQAAPNMKKVDLKRQKRLYDAANIQP